MAKQEKVYKFYEDAGHGWLAVKKQELFDYIERIKSEAFGINVKRRVILGNFLLSSRFEDFNEKVIEAQKIRRLIID